MGANRNIRFSDAIDKYIDEHPDEIKEAKGITGWINAIAEAVINGQLIHPEDLDSKDLDALKQEKLKWEIEIAKLKKDRMEAIKVIDEAAGIRVDILKATARNKNADADYKEMRNQLMRQQHHLPGASVHLISKQNDGSTATNNNNNNTKPNIKEQPIYKAFPCKYCKGQGLSEGVITFWKNLGTDKKPIWKLYEWDGHIETPHYCKHQIIPSPQQQPEQPKGEHYEESRAIICETCKERFGTFMHTPDALDSLLDKFTEHLSRNHDGRALTTSEANQFRALRDAEEKGGKSA